MALSHLLHTSKNPTDQFPVLEERKSSWMLLELNKTSPSIIIKKSGRHKHLCYDNRGIYNNKTKLMCRIKNDYLCFSAFLSVTFSRPITFVRSPSSEWMSLSSLENININSNVLTLPFSVVFSGTIIFTVIYQNE